MSSFEESDGNESFEARRKQVVAQLETLIEQLKTLLLHSTGDSIAAANDNRDERKTMIKGQGGAQTKVTIEEMRGYLRRGVFALEKLKSATSVGKQRECIDFAKVFARDIGLVFPFLPTSLGVPDHEQ